MAGKRKDQRRWSWTLLVETYGEERALYMLEDMPGTGEYDHSVADEPTTYVPPQATLHRSTPLMGSTAGHLIHPAYMRLRTTGGGGRDFRFGHRRKDG